MSVPDIELSDGVKIPQVGLGTWQVTDQAEFDTAFFSAIDAGYRHFDTAQAYGNEAYLGEAIKSQDIKRNSLFITTKIAVQHFGGKKLKVSFQESLSKLSTDYVDLLLLHFPVTVLRKRAWLGLEEIKASGAAKSESATIQSGILRSSRPMLKSCQSSIRWSCMSFYSSRN